MVQQMPEPKRTWCIRMGLTEPGIRPRSCFTLLQFYGGCQAGRRFAGERERVIWSLRLAHVSLPRRSPYHRIICLRGVLLTQNNRIIRIRITWNG